MNYTLPETIKFKEHTISRLHYAIFVTHGGYYKIEAHAENHLSQHNKSSKTVHAEIAALNKLIRNKNITKNSNKKQKFNLIVLRYTKSGKLSTSRPCLHCIDRLEEACMKYGIIIKTVYYSTTDGKIESEKFCDMKYSQCTQISSWNKIILGINTVIYNDRRSVK